MSFFDPRLTQGTGRMFPGTLGGQSQIASPASVQARRRPNVSRCPMDRGLVTFDYGTLRQAGDEIWFPDTDHIDVRDYPSLVETDYFVTPTHGGNATGINRGAMTRDDSDVFYWFATDTVTGDQVLFSMDGPTRTPTVLNDTTWDNTFFCIGLVWHPLDGNLYAVVDSDPGGTHTGSLYRIDPTTGTPTSLVSGDPLNGVGGSDFPIVATAHYVVSTLDHTASPRGLFAWDITNATYTTDSSVENEGFIPTPVTDEVIAWDVTAGVSRSWQITSPSGTPVFTESSSPLRRCSVFLTDWFDDGYTTAGSRQVFHTSDIWEYR